LTGIIVLAVMFLLLIGLGVYPFHLIDVIQSIGSSLDNTLLESIQSIP